MSTTVELGKATAEIARLRAGIEALIADWEEFANSPFGPTESGVTRYAYGNAAGTLRALLDES